MISQDNPNMIEAALRYRLLGYTPIPVKGRSKEPLLRGWLDLRPEPHDIPGLFTGDVSVGIALGQASGWLVDVDLDCPEARRLAVKYLPPTQAKTGRDSATDSHWWYIAPGTKTKRFKDQRTGGMIVELRSTGCQTVVGPSVHPSGERYTDLVGEPSLIEADELLAAVEALHNAVLVERHGERAARSPSPESQQQSRPAPLLPDRSWHGHDLAEPDDAIAVPMERRVERCRSYIAKCRDAVSGAGGHDATFRVACECSRFGLDRPAARRVMNWFNSTKTGGEPWTDREIDHKLDDAEQVVRASNEMEIRIRADARRGGMSLESIARLQTDVGNAARFVLQHGGRFRYSFQRDAWLVWDGCRWAWDMSGAVIEAAKQTSLAILTEAKGGAETDDNESLRKWAKSTQRLQRITSMITLAQPDLAVVSDDLDADPWLFNCLNGTIDLRTGVLRPHDPADLITHLAPVEYDPAATCPRFKAFLDRIFGSNQDLIAFVRKWHGYSLTGDVRHQYLPIFHGEGNNGKSVLLDTISWVMGDYAAEAPPDLMIVRKHAEHPTQIADLCGRRLVVASETEDGAELNLALIKRLTGNERLKARYMRQDYFEFARTHKFVLVTNHKPVVQESTEAAWRRLLLVPFSVVIPPGERDPNLSESLRRESPGILAWLVVGAREDLVVPDAVKIATNAYRGRSNSFEEFLDAECQFDPQAVTLASDIGAAYEDWAMAEGLAVQKGRAPGAALRRRGCIRAKLSTARAWRGIALPDAGPNAPNQVNVPDHPIHKECLGDEPDNDSE